MKKLALVLALTACTPHTAQRTSSTVMGGSLLGVMATSGVMAAAPETKPVSEFVAASFGLTAVIACAVYIVAVGGK